MTEARAVWAQYTRALGDSIGGLSGYTIVDAFPFGPKEGGGGGEKGKGLLAVETHYRVIMRLLCNLGSVSVQYTEPVPAAGFIRSL